MDEQVLAELCRAAADTAVPEPPNIEDGGVGGTKFLSHLLTRSPFRDYFVRLSEAQYSGRDRDERMRNAGQIHPRLLRLVIFADMVLRVVVVVLLLAATAAVAYKTIWPLPAASFGD